MRPHTSPEMFFSLLSKEGLSWATPVKVNVMVDPGRDLNGKS